MSVEYPSGSGNGDEAEPVDGVADSAAAAAGSVEPVEPKKPARKRTPRPQPADAAAQATPEPVPDVVPEVAAEDAAQAEGSTGGPIEQAALAAVAEGPSAFAAPHTAAIPSANGSSAARPAVPPHQFTSAGVAASSRPATGRLALGGLAAVVAFVLWRRRR